MVSDLVYYSDTHTFFDQHYHEIEEIRESFEQNHGYPFFPTGDLKNDLAWFTYEQVAIEIQQYRERLGMNYLIAARPRIKGLIELVAEYAGWNSDRED